MRQRYVLTMALAAALLTTRASAQQDPRRAQAEALFKEALDLHDDKREVEALSKFEKAYALLPTSNLLYWIAREEQLVGKSLTSLRRYREVLKDGTLHPDNVQFAKKFIAELEPRFARVVIRGPAGTLVSIGGKQFRLPIEEAIDLEPGVITVKGERDGLEYTGTGPAEAGKTSVMELHASAAPVGPPQEVRPSPSPARWIVPIGLGVIGVAGVAVGAAYLAKGNTAVDDSRTLLKSGSCMGVMSAECQRALELRSDRDSASTLSTASFLVGGGFLLAAGAAMIFWPSKDANQGRSGFRPLLSPTLAGAQASFSF
jgi:hypothetical protein